MSQFIFCTWISVRAPISNRLEFFIVLGSENGLRLSSRITHRVTSWKPMPNIFKVSRASVSSAIWDWLIGLMFSVSHSDQSSWVIVTSFYWHNRVSNPLPSLVSSRFPHTEVSAISFPWPWPLSRSSTFIAEFCVNLLSSHATPVSTSVRCEPILVRVYSEFMAYGYNTL